MFNIYSFQITHNLFIITTLLAPLLLYAEIHYNPHFLRGILYRKQPEIIFDTPQRIDTDNLPVAFIVKDSHKFPIKLLTVHINIYIANQRQETFTFQENQFLDKMFFHKIYALDVKKYIGQNITIKCSLEYSINNQQKTVINNNYPTLKDKELSVYIDPDKRPHFPGWKWGDLHCHSHYTEDQVEFGLPLPIVPQISRQMGLFFVAITDHSYDLDDHLDSWTGSDPELYKWHNMNIAINKINSDSDDFLLLPGEEVSTDNGRGKTVHMLVINANKYYPGSGDSFENGFFQKSEFAYDKILDQLPEDALGIAAHPFEKPSRIQSILLKRGVWDIDQDHKNLAGYQILNGKQIDGFEAGKKAWIDKLLHGHKKYIYAGNDSHGFLNNFISIKAPLFSLNNSDLHIFGEMLTGVKSNQDTIPGLIADLKNNPVIISNGPFLTLSIFNHDHPDKQAQIGETLAAHPDVIKISAKSTPYFGKIKKVSSYISDYHNQRERLVNTYNLNNYSFEKEIALTNLPNKGYIRSVLATTKGKFAFTNPVWFDIHQDLKK